MSRNIRLCCILMFFLLALSLFAGAFTFIATASRDATQAGKDSAGTGSSKPVANANWAPADLVISGPGVLATSPSYGESATYKISITGGPASQKNVSGVNWSYIAYLKGEFANAGNKSGPLLETAAKAYSNQTGNFTFNVTAPIVECTVTLYVNATSAAQGNQSVIVERTMTIKVVKPVILTAQVHNSGSIGVRNIVVKFYVDDKYIGSKNIASLAANASANVTLNWTVTEYTNGYHNAKMVIEGSGSMIVFSNGTNTQTTEFFIGQIGPDPFGKVWLALGVLLLVVVIVMFVMAYFSTGRPPVQPVKKL